MRAVPLECSHEKKRGFRISSFTGFFYHNKIRCEAACFGKLTFKHFFNVRKVNRVVKFDGSEHRRCEEIP